MTDVANPSLSLSSMLVAAYPDRFYGVPNADKTAMLFPPVDVYNARTVTGLPFAAFMSLPAASELVPLTEAQVTLMLIPSASGVINPGISGTSLTHPERFYCDDNVPARFFDAWAYSSTQALPAGLHPVPYDVWKARMDSAATGLKEMVWDATTKALKDYVAPEVKPVTVPLATQAQNELSGWVAQQASLTVAMGKVFSAKMNEYVTTLRSIASQAQGSPQSLPARPADGEVAAE